MTEAYSDHSPHLRGKDIADREERRISRDRGIILQPRYREVVGETPVLAAGDVAGARKYLERIVRALQKGGWTRDERNRLKRIKRKWTAKAEGRDKWFMENGNPMSGEEGNAYGREGWKEQRRREEIKRAIAAINEKYGRGNSRDGRDKQAKAEETKGI